MQHDASISAAILTPCCTSVAVPGKPLLALLFVAAPLVAQNRGCLHCYKLRNTLEWLPLLMLLTAAILTYVVLGPPCLFQIPFVRLRMEARIAPAVAGYRNQVNGEEGWQST